MWDLVYVIIEPNYVHVEHVEHPQQPDICCVADLNAGDIPVIAANPLLHQAAPHPHKQHNADCSGVFVF